MKNYFREASNRIAKLAIGLLLGLSLFTSCKDDYFYDNLMPSWLGSSIYDYLQDKGNYKYTVKLIDDLNYADVLKKTGSKTLFVANDSAFEAFFKANPWGVSSYSQLTLAQKKLLFNFTMINNAYVIETLSNYYSNGVLYEATAMRRETASSPLDSVPFDSGDKLPTSAYWKYYQTKGLHVLKDDSYRPIVFFTEPFIQKYSLTDFDFEKISGGQTRTFDDMHLFDAKVVKRDIVCKNGYIQVLNKVLLPPVNMAQHIQDNPETKIFSKLLDRFCVPVYNASISSLYKTLHPEFSDSIFVKKYFASNGGTKLLPNSQLATNLLTYDPGWNGYKTNALQADMAAMFVPTDEAMTNYFNSGVGSILKNRFGSWENVPDAIIIPFLKRHMRTSFIESVPSKFSKMVDAENYKLPVEISHIKNAYTAVNGEVYTTSEVYPPVDYISVYSPVLLSDNSKIMNWAINITETSVDGTKFAFYKLYLNSLVSKYSLFIPTDSYFTKYLDPISYGQDVQGVLKFWYNEKTTSVNATVYKYNKTTDIVGDSIDVITSQAFIQNRLWNLLDSHIVVGDVENGEHYFVTKGNDLIHVTGSGNSVAVQGGDDMAKGIKANTDKRFPQYNGTTYFIDKPIQPALKSVYKVLSETPQFAKFYELLNGVPDTCVSQIFNKQGIDYRITFFNAYRYTVYVPTNEAIQAALDNGTILPWSTIYSIDPGVAKSVKRSEAISKMIRFLRYHFQDDAVFFGQSVNEQFQSATIKNGTTPSHWGTANHKYFKIGVIGDDNSLTLTTEFNKKAHVLTTDGLYNMIAKDYTFAKAPSAYKNIDGTGSATGALFNTSSITAAASAVIHQIDNVLTFE